MEQFDRTTHWENIYNNKALNEVSWYQPIPQISLDLIAECHIDKSAGVIDVGGGDSFLSTFLLEANYKNISVLDISNKSLVRAQERLGEKASRITWIHADIVAFQPKQTYALWHDRAAFHFLTQPHEIETYAEIAAQAITPGGYLIIGTFAVDGPLKCSGIEIQQYNEEKLIAVFGKNFEPIKFERIVHETPFDTTQNFIFGVLKRKENS